MEKIPKPFEKHFFAFIAKPFEKKQLTEAIKSAMVLAKKKPVPEAPASPLCSQFRSRRRRHSGDDSENGQNASGN